MTLRVSTSEPASKGRLNSGLYRVNFQEVPWEHKPGLVYVVYEWGFRLLLPESWINLVIHVTNAAAIKHIGIIQGSYKSGQQNFQLFSSTFQGFSGPYLKLRYLERIKRTKQESISKSFEDTVKLI